MLLFLSHDQRTVCGSSTVSMILSHSEGGTRNIERITPSRFVNHQERKEGGEKGGTPVKNTLSLSLTHNHAFKYARTPFSLTHHACTPVLVYGGLYRTLMWIAAVSPILFSFPCPILCSVSCSNSRERCGPSFSFPPSLRRFVSGTHPLQCEVMNLIIAAVAAGDCYCCCYWHATWGL